MNNKNSFQGVFVLLALTMLNAGCCTYKVLDSFNQKAPDTFTLTTVFLSTNDQKVAIEGIHRRFPYSSNSQAQAYLIIPLGSLGLVQSQTSQISVFNEIKKLPNNSMAGLKLTSELPLSYEKITSAHEYENSATTENDIKFLLNKRRTNKKAIVLLPFAVGIDLVTAPIQITVFAIVFGHMAATGGHM